MSLFRLFLVGSLLTVGLPAALAAAAPAGFKPAVDAQVAAARRTAPEIGVDVVDLETGESVYSFAPDTLRVVASNMKLVTSAASLELLGPGYFFETELLISGNVGRGMLEGDLAVVGGGDPNLSGRGYQGDPYGAFREWARALRRLGIARIDGNVLLVNGLFDAQVVHPDWPRDQLSAWYEAPVAALSFNDNCVLVKVRPGARPGTPARVELVPPLDLFTVKNTAVTVAKAGKQGLGIGRRPGNVINVTGQIARGAGSADEWVAVADPLEYFGAALRAALAEEGIEIAGQVHPTRELPQTAWEPVITWRSDLLSTLEVLNKRSQNFYGESLLKLLAARFCGTGTWEAGARLLRDYLLSIGLDPGGFEVADGSGMSRRNRFSPRQLTHLLARMFRHRWGSEYLRTLPFSGEPELRWERRLATPPYRGNVLAKTGTLAAVSTLSGYAKARSGKLYAFSILCNRSSSGGQSQRAQDRIVQAIIDHG